MPRVKPLIQKPDYSGIEISIRAAMLKNGYRTVSKFFDATGYKLKIARSTLYDRFNSPEEFTLGEIKEISIMLNTPFEELVGCLFKGE